MNIFPGPGNVPIRFAEIHISRNIEQVLPVVNKVVEKSYDEEKDLDDEIMSEIMNLD